MSWHNQTFTLKDTIYNLALRNKWQDSPKVVKLKNIKPEKPFLKSPNFKSQCIKLRGIHHRGWFSEVCTKKWCSTWFANILFYEEQDIMVQGVDYLILFQCKTHWDLEFLIYNTLKLLEVVQSHDCQRILAFGIWLSEESQSGVVLWISYNSSEFKDVLIVFFCRLPQNTVVSVLMRVSLNIYIYDIQLIYFLQYHLQRIMLVALIMPCSWV